MIRLILAFLLSCSVAVAGIGINVTPFPGPGILVSGGGGGGTAPTIRNSAISTNTRRDDQTVVLPQPVSGNYIVVFAFSFSTMSTNGISDSAGNTYTRKAIQGDANGNYVAVYTAPVTATGSGNDTITSIDPTVLIAIEVSGQASSTPDDGVAVGTFIGSAGGVVSAASITTTFAADLILSGGIDQNTAALTVNTGTLVRGSTTLNCDTIITQARTTSSTGTYTESFNVPTSANETAAIVAIAIKGL